LGKTTDPVRDGEFTLPAKPALGIELNTDVCAEPPYRKNSLASLWDKQWLADFIQNKM
jgi:hypothetical protein